MKTFKEFVGDNEKEENPQVQVNNQKREFFKQRAKDVLNRVKKKAQNAQQKGKEMIAKNRQQSYNDIARMKEKNEQ